MVTIKFTKSQLPYIIVVLLGIYYFINVKRTENGIDSYFASAELIIADKMVWVLLFALITGFIISKKLKK